MKRTSIFSLRESHREAKIQFRFPFRPSQHALLWTNTSISSSGRIAITSANPFNPYSRPKRLRIESKPLKWIGDQKNHKSCRMEKHFKLK